MLVGGVLAGTIGYKWTFQIMTVCTACGVAIAYLEMRSRPPSGIAQLKNSQVAELKIYDVEDQKKASTEKSSDLETSTELEPMTSRATLWQIFVVFLGGFTNRLVIDGIVTPVLGYLLLSRFGENIGVLGLLTVPVASLTGALQSCRGFVEMIVAPTTGYLGDRFGRHRVRACRSLFTSLSYFPAMPI